MAYGVAVKYIRNQRKKRKMQLMLTREHTL